MDFDTWYDQNYELLTIEFVSKNPELGILDDDLSDLGNNSLFQDWCEDKFSGLISEAIGQIGNELK